MWDSFLTSEWDEYKEVDRAVCSNRSSFCLFSSSFGFIWIENFVQFSLGAAALKWFRQLVRCQGFWQSFFLSPQKPSAKKVYLSGYGVELAIKSQEYKAKDDTQVQGENAHTGIDVHVPAVASSSDELQVNWLWFQGRRLMLRWSERTIRWMRSRDSFLANLSKWLCISPG